MNDYMKEELSRFEPPKAVVTGVERSDNGREVSPQAGLVLRLPPGVDVKKGDALVKPEEKQPPTIADDCALVSLEAIQTPADGHIVYMNRWWVVTPENNVLIWVGRNRKSFSPQCNHDESVARLLLKKGAYPPACRVEMIPVAYVPAKARYG